MMRGTLVGDQVRCNMHSTAIAVPENAPVLVATITGAPTYAANTETLIGTYRFTGPLVGDFAEVSLQQIATLSSGSWGDWLATASVSAINQVRVYVRNRSATDVVMASGNAYRVLVAWKRRRV